MKSMSIGDIVKVECRPFEKKLIFTNETQNNKLTIPVDFNKYDDIHPFIYLTNQGDSIQFLINE